MLEKINLGESAFGLTEPVNSPTRRRFLALASMIGGAALVGSLYKPARADLVATLGKIFYLDPTVLNFAFAIEELQTDFFIRARLSPGFKDFSEAERNFFFLCGSQDNHHMEKLKALRPKFQARDAGSYETLNAVSSRQPRIFRYPSLSSREKLMKTALDIKENALFTYHGAVGLVKSKELLGTAAAIAGVEGRHVAVLREMMGQDPVPAPFEGAITAQIAGERFFKYGIKGGAPQQ